MLKLEQEVKKLINGELTPVRIYKNTVTGSELKTQLLRVDMAGNSFWGFEDLFAIPFIRQIAAKKVIDLYGQGLTREDIKKATGELRAILKSSHAEKYELAIAKIHELENLSESVGDPVRQVMGLCTVYLLMNDEPPDVWRYEEKMSALALDIDSQAFFLNWWIEVTKNFGQVLKGLSQIVSKTAELSGNRTLEPTKN